MIAGEISRIIGIRNRLVIQNLYILQANHDSFNKDSFRASLLQTDSKRYNVKCTVLKVRFRRYKLQQVGLREKVDTVTRFKIVDIIHFTLLVLRALSAENY